MNTEALKFKLILEKMFSDLVEESPEEDPFSIFNNFIFANLAGIMCNFTHLQAEIEQIHQQLPIKPRIQNDNFN